MATKKRQQSRFSRKKRIIASVVVIAIIGSMFVTFILSALL